MNASDSQAKKRFGQNFLHDRGIIQAILREVYAQPGEALIEIGPGRGALTEGLLAAAGRLQAIEIDRDLYEALSNRFGDALTLIQQDVLTVDFAALADAAGQPLRIVGNLPYNISSPILFHLLPVAHRIQDQTFMLQREVVERMVAEPGSKTYGRLSVMLQARYVMEKVIKVPGGAFTPAPKVESAVVRMWPLSPAAVQVQDWAVFEALVAAAFATRRKMLRNTLADYLDRLDWAAAGVDPSDRAEAISVAAFARLANQLVPSA